MYEGLIAVVFLVIVVALVLAFVPGIITPTPPATSTTVVVPRTQYSTYPSTSLLYPYSSYYSSYPSWSGSWGNWGSNRGGSGWGNWNGSGGHGSWGSGSGHHGSSGGST